MKVGLYGGMANNMYVFAKAMAKNGVDTCFIRDRADAYPMSQPVWEDVPFRMRYDEVPGAASWPWSRWAGLERELKWAPPAWLYDPLPDVGGTASIRVRRRSGAMDGICLARYVREPRAAHRAPVLRAMQSCDALLVCGVEGTILANASGRPFVILPHGGDLLIAAGLLAPPLWQVRSRIRHRVHTRQLAWAYANSLGVGAHEPTAFSIDFYGAEEFFRQQQVHFLAVPIPTRARSVRGERRQALDRLLGGLGLPPQSSEYVGFVPSRVDYEWKGQDRLLHALARLNRRGAAADVHLIFSGWGTDLTAARDFVRAEGLANHVSFLNCALSKPLLYDLFSSADFVVDQFVVGMTGTAALEAMSCGAPLMTWVNQRAERKWGFPPILQARTSEDIEAVLGELGAGRLELDRVGAAGREWVGRLHDPEKVAREFLAIFQGA